MTQGVSIQWDFNNDPLLERLAQLAETDLSKLHSDIGGYLIGEIHGRFDSGTLWDGSKMEQSAAAEARGGQTLIETHHLYDYYVWQSDGQNIEVGSDTAYAAIHHYGGRAGRKVGRMGPLAGITLPARPVLGVNANDEQAIGQMIFDAIGGV